MTPPKSHKSILCLRYDDSSCWIDNGPPARYRSRAPHYFMKLSVAGLVESECGVVGVSVDCGSGESDMVLERL